MAYRRANNYPRKRKTPRSYAPYRSQFEKDLHQQVFKDLQYEGDTLYYTMTKKYIPDFVPKSKAYYIEAKGYFRDSNEARKYVELKKSNPDLKLIFVLANPKKKAYPQCKRRKDNTFLTMGEWCDKHGFEYYTPATVPQKYRR
jgi:predicted nuclease of restriction endonuclease-like RecB superfamily